MQTPYSAYSGFHGAGTVSPSGWRITGATGRPYFVANS